MLEAIPDGRGVHMLDGKMQDDATWKQCKVMVGLAEMLAAKDPELARRTDLRPLRAELQRLIRGKGHKSAQRGVAGLSMVRLSHAVHSRSAAQKRKRFGHSAPGAPIPLPSE